MSEKIYRGAGRVTSWSSLKMPDKMDLGFDSVSLVPRVTAVLPEAVDTSVEFGPYTLKVPVIASPAAGNGEEIIRELSQSGALGTLPQARSDKTFKANLSLAERLRADEVRCLYTIGMEGGFEQASQLVRSGAEIVLLDVTNGAQVEAIELASRIADETGIEVVGGSIATREQADAYHREGVSIVRVGSPDNDVYERTGVGTGQLSTVFDTSPMGVIIADFGLTRTSDMTKALAAGAQAVMVGHPFAYAYESPGEVVYSAGTASKLTLDTREHGRPIPVTGYTGDIIRGIRSGLQETMSLVGVGSITDLQQNARFALTSSVRQLGIRQS